MLHNTSATETSSFISVALTAQQNMIKVQKLRIKDGVYLTGIEATLDLTTNEHVVSYQDIESQLSPDLQVIWIARARTGSMISPLKDAGHKYLEPRRVIYSDELMEVHLATRQTITTPAEISRLAIQDYDILFKAKNQFRKLGELELESECNQALGQRYTTLLHTADAIDENRVNDFVSPQALHDDIEKLHIAIVNIQDSITYTVPRRFYVMYRKQSRLGKMFSRSMRLFLLCECDLHRYESEADLNYNCGNSDAAVVERLEEDEDDTYIADLPLVHLSNHKGYSIKEPSDLCRDFGTYLLPLLKYLRYTAVAAGIVIPALAPLNIPAWISGVQNTVNYNNQSLSEVWQSTINFVSEHMITDGFEMMDHDGEDEMDDLLDGPVFQPLVGKQYRMFETLLKSIDKTRIYGNLRETFGPKGGIKWVCKDHDGEESEQFWRTLVALEISVGGKVNQTEGHVKFTVQKDDRIMDRFYDALSEASGIKRVTVYTGPDLTVKSLKTLRDQLTKANVRNLVLDGSQLMVASPSDLKSIQDWLVVLLEIMFNERRHVVRVIGLGYLFVYLPQPKLQPARFMELLELDFDFDIDRHQDKLLFMLSLCPSIKVLKLRAVFDMKLLNHIRYLNLSNRLLSLQMTGPDHVILGRSPTDLSRTTYEVRTTGIGFTSLDIDLEGKVTTLKLQLSSNPSDNFRLRLTDVLDKNQDLKMIYITTPLPTFDLLRDAFKSTNAYRHGDADYSVQLRTPGKYYKGHKVMMWVRYEGSTATTISTDVEMTGTNIDNDQLENIFRKHGPTIRSLVANARLDSDFMDLYVGSRNSQSQVNQLESLTMDPSSLAETVELADLVDMTKGLKHLKFCFSTSVFADSLKCERVCSMLKQVGDNITGLILDCNSLSDIVCPSTLGAVATGGYQATTCILPGYKKTPKMTELSLSFEKDTRLVTNQGHDRALMDWIVNNISKTPSSPTPALSSVKALVSLTLCSIELSVKNWDRILKALSGSAVEKLSFERTNFEADQMKTLIEQYPRPSMNLNQMANRRVAPLIELLIIGTPLARPENRKVLARLETRMLQRVRDVTIVIADDDDA